MIDWDDVRYFLAVANGGSVRAAAEQLGVNHSTVLRRISQLEQRLGARMFDKLPSGYRVTEAGQDIVQFAERMAAASTELETRVFGRDQRVRGRLRVTMTEMLATNLLMPDLADFAHLQPEIELELLSGDEPVNLTNREADVALRIVHESSALPPNLHAWKGPDIFGSVYISGALLATGRKGTPMSVPWILKEFDGIPAWGCEGELTVSEVPFRTTGAGPHIAALQQGMGMTALPCFVGDAMPTVVRVPGTGTHRYGTLWMLTQGETRRTKRVQLFTQFAAKRLTAYVDLLAGSPQQDA